MWLEFIVVMDTDDEGHLECVDNNKKSDVIHAWLEDTDVMDIDVNHVWYSDVEVADDAPTCDYIKLSDDILYCSDLGMVI